jgi:H+-transporting ATPase
MGSRELAAHGAIVARLAAVEELAGMNVLCSDKTGTLTLNKMVIQADSPVYEEDEEEGKEKEEKAANGDGAAATAAATHADNRGRARLLRWAALASRWREPPADALDAMTLGAADLPALEDWDQVDFEPFEPTTKRTRAVVRAPPPDGRFYGVAKGAAASIQALLPPGSEAEAAKMNADIDAAAQRGVRCIAVARTAGCRTLDAAKAAPWRVAGLLAFLDPPRPDTKATLDAALAAGVDVKMVTGDSAVIARETARVLGLVRVVLCDGGGGGLAGRACVPPCSIHSLSHSTSPLSPTSPKRAMPSSRPTTWRGPN